VSALELRDVAKHYRAPDGDVVRAIDGVTLKLEPGSMLALYGPSGSGKTTLLLLAAGLLMPDAGGVAFAGMDIPDLSPDDLADYQRHTVGFVSQSLDLMAGVPALENAAVKLLADGIPLARARGRTAPWLERVGLGKRTEHTPEQLSRGECQRVAIARALVNGPRLILADEPTGNLDSEHGAEILRLLAAITHENQVATLLVTHDPQAAAIADEVLTLRDGQLRREEPPLGDLTPVTATEAIG
jgi:putative ABC transport system ATP-binding protein